MSKKSLILFDTATEETVAETTTETVTDESEGQDSSTEEVSTEESETQETEEETQTLLGKGEEGETEGDTGEPVIPDYEKLEKFIPIAKELKLDQGSAQKMVDVFVEMQESDAKQARQEFLDLQQDWLKELDKNPDFGGDNKDETLKLANKVVGRFGGDDLRAVLNDTGMGNHHQLIMTFARIGRLMGEDRLVTAGDKTISRNPKSDGEIFYPNMGKT
jgi:hypothetical protein